MGGKGGRGGEMGTENGKEERKMGRGRGIRCEGPVRPSGDAPGSSLYPGDSALIYNCICTV